VIPLQPGVAQKVGRGIALLFHDRGTKRVSGQQHAPAAPYPRRKPGTHCTGGWVSPRACLDGRKISSRDRDSIPGHPARSSVAITTELSVAIPTELPGIQRQLVFARNSGNRTLVFEMKCLRVISSHTRIQSPDHPAR